MQFVLRLRFQMLCEALFLQLVLTISSMEIYQKLDRNWILLNANQSIKIKTNVPGGVYTDLMNADFIEDILYRFNDIKYRWISKENWTYYLPFKVEKSMFSYEHLDLVFDGIDTYADIYLNNKLILQSDNMFVQYKMNVKPFIEMFQNNLSIFFHSPISKAQELYDDYFQHYGYHVPPVCVPKEYNGECHVNFLRKMQASFGWDWGPAFPSVGLWKPVYLMAYNNSKIDYVTTSTIFNGFENLWNLNVTIYFSGSHLFENITLNLKIQLENVEFQKFYDLKNNVESFSTQIQIYKYYIKNWWPNGFGDQNLYNLNVNLLYKDTLKTISSKNIKIGFRTIELIQDPIEKNGGNEFYFKINDRQIFIKGSNWIPMDVLPEKSYDLKKLKNLLSSVKSTNMNMLRVWGGGLYESDEFYDLADQYGILIWQDFMFACSMYPVNDNFLKSVKTEVIQQVLRLSHHASIAIWAGNNENEAALGQNWYNTFNKFDQYKNDYIKLYVENIKRIVEKFDPIRTYILSSPTNGLETEREGFLSKNPYDGRFGDIHHYNYYNDSFNQFSLPKTRFISEFGYQSMPFLTTFEKQTNLSSDLGLYSEFLQKRQHLVLGWVKIRLLMNYQFKIRKQFNITALIYLSQVHQAISVQKAYEYYRTNQSQLDSQGYGHTMGAMYWQLNDVWAAPSWSSIDYQGKWKMLHYVIKRIYSPIILATFLNDQNYLDIYSVSDQNLPLFNVSLVLKVYKWESLTPIYKKEEPIVLVNEFESKKLYSLNVGWFLRDEARCDTNRLVSLYRCFIYIYIKNNEKFNPIAENYIFPKPFKHIIGLERATIEFTIRNMSESVFEIKLRANQVALFVWLDSGHVNGTFADNGFIIGENGKTINFLASDSATTLLDLQNNLKVTSLYDYMTD